MVAASAGLLLYRRGAGGLEVLLVHPGGPFWKNKDAGAWSLPKGELTAGEDPAAAARREFAEETGHRAPAGPLRELGEIRQRGGKTVTGFAAEGDLDPETLRSNTFEMIWPPRSGRLAVFPECDRGQWFGLAEAAERINPAQAAFLDRLRAQVTDAGPPAG
ncbi:NUDIX domain-containing protein [Gordonia sp. VNK21]|uniref:NUDIX domain-containing protein n=1 Tax=Gordonia sp. VNK21 TaxID=3382483 RepID=UPI0038D3F774